MIDAWLLVLIGACIGILLMCLMFMARESPRPTKPTPYGMGPLDVDTVTR